VTIARDDAWERPAASSAEHFDLAAALDRRRRATLRCPPLDGGARDPWARTLGAASRSYAEPTPDERRASAIHTARAVREHFRWFGLWSELSDRVLTEGVLDVEGRAA
jgi:hypothetical protein